MGGGRQARMLPACLWPMCDEGGRSSHEQRQCCTGGVGLAVIDEEDIGGGERERRRVTVVKGADCGRGITSQILAVMLSDSAATP